MFDFYSGFDMHGAPFKQAKFEVVSSLPTTLYGDTLAPAHIGYTVTYLGNHWIWDGTKWNCNYSRHWITGTNHYNAGTLRTEASEIVYTRLDPTANDLYIIDHDTATNRPLGTIKTLGHTLTTFNFVEARGTIVEIQADKDCWFKIADNQTPSDASQKKIYTYSNGDVDRVKKARFLLDASGGFWHLIGFVQINNFIQTYTINSQYAAGNQVSITCPPTGGLPFKGLYKYTVYATVQELASGLPAPTNVAQTLQINGTEVDKSFITDLGRATGSVYNQSLQGSKNVSLTNANPATRFATILITLPNGDAKQVLSGYIEVEFLDTSSISLI